MSENDQPIIELSTREHIRKRPGMYFGGTDRRALHRLVGEVLENSLLQAKIGYCNRIEIILSDENSISVSDNGNGVPVELYRHPELWLLELSLSQPGDKHLIVEKNTF